jgi:hypothetical protein
MSKNLEKNLSPELEPEPEPLPKMSTKKLITTVLSQAQNAIDNLELLSAASKLAGVPVPAQVELAFKITKGAIKSATILTTKQMSDLGASNVLDIGVGFVLPTAKSMGLNSSLNHLGKAAQITAKLRDKLIKKDKLLTLNTVGNFAQLHSAISSNRFASRSGTVGQILLSAHKITQKNIIQNKYFMVEQNI